MSSRLLRLLRASVSARLRPAAEPPAGSWAGPDPAARDPALARYYANLELPYGAPPEAVRAARRRLLRRYHPDRFATDPERARLATLLVQQLNHAHDELLKRHP